MEIIVKKSCPYSSDQLVDMSNVGFTDRFKIRTRGIGNRRASATRLVDDLKRKLDNEKRDLSWLEE
jgi:hypothetical protein